MTPRSALLCALLLASCATGRPEAAPMPENGSRPTEVTPPAEQPRLSAQDSARAVRLAADSVARDSIALSTMARDSALDAAMLDRIAAARVADSALPSAAPVEGESAALRSMFDIDVKNFEEHGRVKYWINFFSGPARERMGIWLQRMPRYEPGFRAKLIDKGLPGDLAYLPLIESGYSPTAVSRARATGMWQFMRATGKWYGLAIDAWVDERRDVPKSTEAAVRYLADLTKRFGSPYLAAAAYNGGPGRIQRGLNRMGPDMGPDEEPAADDSTGVEDEEGSPQAGDVAFFALADTRYIRQETKDYVPKLIAAAMIAKQPERYGFPALESTDYELDSVVVTDATGLDVVAKLAGVPLAEVTELNPVFLRAITPPKRRAVIRLPDGTGEATTAALDALPASARLGSFVHHARSGETLTNLGKKYGVPLASLLANNPNLRTRPPKRGEAVVIPGQARLLGWISENRKVSLAVGSAGGSHRVRSGETLGGIARRYRVSVTQLRAWNRIGPKGVIRAGQVLRLDGGSMTSRPRATRSVAAAGGTSTRAKSAQSSTRGGAKVHVVRTGESLWSLARRYGVTVQLLRAANKLPPNQPLPAGRRLTIPS
jgi:membrane-bound lytic murein transglycosylase D